MIVRRLDSVDVRLDTVEVTADGFWLYDAYFARTGNQAYDDGRGGTVIEYRPDDEVEASFPYFELRPLTDLHPPRNVTADTARVLARGATSAARWAADRRHAQGRLAVWDAELQRKFDAARKRGKPMQLSAGYTLDLDPTPGIDPHTGERYDAIQRNIRINHVAAVPLGRAGTAQVLDAADVLADAWGLERARSLADVAPHRTRVHVDMGRWCRHDAADLRISKQQQDTTMKHTIKIDGADVVLELADNATPAQIVEAMAKQYATADAKRKEAHDKAIAEAVKKAKADALKVAADMYGKKPEEEEEEMGDGKKPKADAKPVDIEQLRKDARAEARRDAEILGAAKAVLGLHYTADGKDIEQVQLDVIGRVLGDGARKDAEADPGATGYLYRKALAAHDEQPSHGDALVSEIRRANAAADSKNDDAKPGPIVSARKDAEDQAALPRHLRTNADQKAS